MIKYVITYNAPGVVNAKTTVEAPDKKTALTLFYLSTPGALEVLDVKKVSSADE